MAEKTETRTGIAAQKKQQKATMQVQVTFEIPASLVTQAEEIKATVNE